MTQREKILAALGFGVLLLWGGATMKGKYDAALTLKRGQLNSARELLGDAQLELARGREAVEKLEAWQQRSLPANTEMAQSVYRTWLEDRAKVAGVTVDDMVPAQRLAATDAYKTIGYKMTARGSIKSLVTLLYEFYKSPLLQQITRLQVRPGSDATQLAITLEVEALSVPGTTNETVPKGNSDRLAKKSAAEYSASLSGRNMLTVYTPPRPLGTSSARSAPPPPPEFDASKHAYVTGIVQVGGRLQAWITVRTTGEVLRLYEGDPVKVGLLEGKIVSISPRMLVLEAGDEQLRIDLGKNLREGKAVPKT
jgi:hypothetical protein